jgi:hypothetical protein
MPSRTDVGRVRDALEAITALNLLEERGQGPARAADIRRKLDEVLEGFVLSPEITFTAKKLSGSGWVSEFPDRAATSDLIASFRTGTENFVAAMRTGGATVTISSTLRPKERAYLMHYAWRVAKQEIAAKDVPAMSGVDIEWVHPNDAASRQGAQDMVDGYHLKAKPALTSRHTEGRAIDMTISWSGNLVITDADGTSSTIPTAPRNGENTDLVAVGATYGVVKATFTGDPPHWSDDGH